MPDIAALESAADHLQSAVSRFSAEDWKGVVPDVQAATASVVEQVQEVRARQHWYTNPLILLAVIGVLLFNRGNLNKKLETANERLQGVEEGLSNLRASVTRFLDADDAEVPDRESILQYPNEMKRLLSHVQELRESREALEHAVSYSRIKG